MHEPGLEQTTFEKICPTVVLKNKKALKSIKIPRLSRGLERIRTAVEAFAELCLAARPRDPFFTVQGSEFTIRVDTKLKKSNGFTTPVKKESDPELSGPLLIIISSAYSDLGSPPPDILSLSAARASRSPRVDFSVC
jgi:hypothetical protein